VSLRVIYKPRARDDPGPLCAVAAEEKKYIKEDETAESLATIGKIKKIGSAPAT
jgi:hypothetical protein